VSNDALVDEILTAARAQAGGHDRPGRAGDWQPLDLAPILDGGHVDPAPALLYRVDGAGLIYPGKVHSFAGESESLKSWALLVAAVAEINAGRVVAWLDFEDSAPSVVGRLLALGASREAILSCFRYHRPSEPLGTARGAILADLLADRPTLAVIDGVTEAMSLLGLDPSSNADVATFLTALVRPLAGAGAAVATIDHVTKSREGRGRYAIGAQHKLSGLDGAAYTLELAAPFGHGRHGIARMYVQKDRPGRVREHCPGQLAGELHLRSQPDGSVLAEITAPVSQDEMPFRPTVLMSRVSRLLEASPAGLSGRAIGDAVAGKTAGVRLATQVLVSEGYVAVETVGQARLHRSIRPFTEDVDG